MLADARSPLRCPVLQTVTGLGTLGRTAPRAPYEAFHKNVPPLGGSVHLHRLKCLFVAIKAFALLVAFLGLNAQGRDRACI